MTIPLAVLEAAFLPATDLFWDDLQLVSLLEGLYTRSDQFRHFPSTISLISCNFWLNSDGGSLPTLRKKIMASQLPLDGPLLTHCEMFQDRLETIFSPLET